MWQLKTMEVMNPAGVVALEKMGWPGEVRFFGPRRELLFIGLGRKILSPDLHMVFNFNPRAQLFRSLQVVLFISEQLLELTANEPDNAKIGSWLKGTHSAIAGDAHAESLLVILRAEVLYLFGSLCALVSHRPPQEMSQFFDHISSISRQSDELLPLAVERALGKEMRSIYENLCGAYYFRSAAGQLQRKEWLFHAEQKISSLLSQHFSFEWDAGQEEGLCVRSPAYDHSRGGASAVFIPYCSSSYDCEGGMSVSVLCQNLLTAGVDKFVLIESFVEQLRWVERLSISRQQTRVNAVKEEPLRSQAILDARSGRTQIPLLSEESLQMIDALLRSHRLADFSISAQEKIESALEVRQLRRQLSYPTNPCFDFLLLARHLCRGSHPEKEEKFFSSVMGYERLLGQGRFQAADLANRPSI